MTDSTPPSRLTKAQLKAEVERLQASHEQLTATNQQLQQAVASARNDELVFMSIRVPRALRERAKDIGRKLDLPLQDVVRDALDDWVDRKTAELETQVGLPLDLN